jgi:hypothetical protein
VAPLTPDEGRTRVQANPGVVPYHAEPQANFQRFRVRICAGRHDTPSSPAASPAARRGVGVGRATPSRPWCLCPRDTDRSARSAGPTTWLSGQCASSQGAASRKRVWSRTTHRSPHSRRPPGSGVAPGTSGKRKEWVASDGGAQHTASAALATPQAGPWQRIERSQSAPGVCRAGQGRAQASSRCPLMSHLRAASGPRGYGRSLS